MGYEFMGFDAASNTNHFHVTLKIYRYCDQSGGGTAPLDPSMMLGIYPQDEVNPNADKIWYETDFLDLTSQQFITPPNPGSNCTFNTTVCVEQGIFEADIYLPPSTGGYHLIVERCCRNGNIVNLSSPGSIGQSYYCFIPADPVTNSSPLFNDIPVPFICNSDTVTIVNTATDPDGDVLVYSFVTPYAGYSSSGISSPDPQLDNDPYVMPVPDVFYNPGYSVTEPFGATGYASIDSLSGQTSYYIPTQGFYVVAIEIKEYRNGVLISSVRRDLQLISIACPPNNAPALSTNNGSGVTNLVINEGETLCFPVIFVDPEGDSLYLTSSGNIFNSSIINPPATLNNAAGNGIVANVFCWSTECGQARNAPYQFTVSALDNGCPPKQTNKVYSIKVNPSVLPPAPAVSIAVSPSDTICMGTAVTFTATPTFGGTSPQYQWQLNGVNVGTNTNTFTSSTINDKDTVICTLTSNSVCVSNFTAVSNEIVMTVNPFVAPTVSVTPNPAGTVCSGTNVVFTAIPTHPGPTLVYQWQVNGVNVGTNSDVFSSTTLTAGNIVSVSLTADANCPSAVSNAVNMSVTPTLTPSVSIAANTGGVVCPLAPITFTASPTNGGSAPSYQWQINGINAGTNSNTFTNSSWTNGDVVSVILTSNFSCLTSPTANSNVINVSVSTPSNPSVSISANPAGAICNGDNVIFTAVPVLGGTSPSYQWKKNGVNTGSNSSVFASASLANGDIISVQITSNSPCATSPTATSNNIVMAVTPVVTPDVHIVSNPAFPVCQGTQVSFTATPTNGGNAPSYQWQVNGINAGTNSTVFTTSTLANGNSVRVILTSNGRCVSPATKTSNVINAVISAPVVPSVTIAASPAGTVCAGTNITFTASPTNGGGNPQYQWRVNGVNAGTNTSTFSSTSLTTGDTVSVHIISNDPCTSPNNATSNNIVMNVRPLVTPLVTITSSADTICPGNNVVFTAVPVNGGNSPDYEWTVNTVPVGTNSIQFASNSLVNGDDIRVGMTTSESCYTTQLAFSNTKTITVRPNVSPHITISANTNDTICYGTPMVYTSNYTNGGASPHFQWLVNGATSGSDTAVFISSTINNHDDISVIITSNALCVLPPQDTSNTVNTLVEPNLTPVINISANPPGQFCDGKQITYTAASINEGFFPSYQWQLNHVTIPQNDSSFSASDFQNLDTLTCILTSSILCPTQNPVISNELIIDRLPPLSVMTHGTEEICFGKVAQLGVTVTGGNNGPYYYTWDNSLSGDTAFVLSPPVTTTYMVSVSDSCSTPRSADFTIEVFALPTPGFAIKPAQATILNPYFDFIDASLNTSDWLWNFGDSTISTEHYPQHIYLNPGSYTVQLIATSNEGCVDSTYHSLFVEEVTTIYFPNSFSPNGDSKNDVFGPVGHAMPDYEMTIYNRWGTQVFSSVNAVKYWNGTMQSTGKPAPGGLYVYKVAFKGSLKKRDYAGEITLIR